MTPPEPAVGNRINQSAAIHQGADLLLSLIESEIAAHTAAARKETAELQANLAALKESSRRREEALEAELSSARSRDIQHWEAKQNIGHLVERLATFGIFCRENGEIYRYNAEWRRLFEELKEDEEDLDAEDLGAEKGEVVTNSQQQTADPLRDLSRVRVLLERRRAEAKRWRSMYSEMEKERDGLKAELTRQLEQIRQR